jgi:glycosyltransferase involved in cell wall biosynthesis
VSVTAVVCTLNAQDTIEQCLHSLHVNNVQEIIVVDGQSTDRTRAIAQRGATLIVDDPGTGLGQARNIGIAKATGDYILNCGADNAMPPGSIDALIEARVVGGYAAVGAVTVVPGRGYLAWAMRQYKLARFTPGERAVIGTPTLFAAKELQANPFDDNAAYSDDGELCERWTRLFGARFAIADVTVHEVTRPSLASVRARFRMYGTSDAETYRRERAGWTLHRRWRSLTHPLRVDFLEPLRAVTPLAALSLFPFLAFITTLRYAGWIRAALRLGAARERRRPPERVPDAKRPGPI